MDQGKQAESKPQSVSKARLIFGGVIFVGGFLSPLLVPLVSQSNLPGNWKIFLSTGLIAGLPEIGMLLAVAILGKQGFALLKGKLFAILRRHTEPSAVSARRYRIGLVMFCIPLIVGWLGPYAAHFFPALGSESLVPVIALDLVFASSFLVLGAEFWEKLRRLFVHSSEGAKAS
jgi:hypothetical protein